MNKEEIFIELSKPLNTKRTVTTIALTESNAHLIPKENLINYYNKKFFLFKQFWKPHTLGFQTLIQLLKLTLKVLIKKGNSSTQNWNSVL